MKTNKGFTLIELLATIAVLAIIITIVVISVTGILDKSETDAKEIDQKMLNRAVELYKTDNYIELKKELDKEGSVKITIEELISEGYLKVDKDDIDLEEEIVLEFNDSGEIIRVVGYREEILNGAVPVLTDGLIPVTIDSDGTVKKADINSEWYKYSNQEWANAVLVRETGNKTRAYYESEESNKKQIVESDILAYYVWIPRYRYELWYDGTDSSPREISITFENKHTPKSINTEKGKFLTHPAFTFGDIESGYTELNGFWVGKFETSGTIGEACTADTCDTADLKIKPGVQSLRNKTVSNMFYASRSMERAGNPYGLDGSKVDTHMMKNIEWGAVVYLSHSEYGRCTSDECTEISINNSNYITGSSAGRPADSTVYNSTVYSYNTSEGYKASTTKNITGIYDMSGGVEYVMGNVKSVLNEFNPESSGFIDGSVAYPDSKYYDSYEAGTTEFNDYHARGKLGDATKETAYWYIDWMAFPKSTNSWFRRGFGAYSANEGAFHFDSNNGNSNNKYSFRLILQTK